MRHSTPIACLALATTALAVAGGARLAGQQPPSGPEDRLLARLQASDRAAGDLFACALSLSGGTLLAGSLLDDDRGSASGAAYVFDLGPDGWSQSAKLFGADTAAGDELGFSVDLAGDRALIGAPLAGGGGAAYLFDRVGGVDGAWRQTARWDGGEGGADFGSAVAFAPGWALVGAPLADAGGRPDSGAVYAFPLRGGSPVRLEAPEPRAGAGLGWAVAGTDEVVAAGAPWSDRPLTGAGMVALFATGPNGFRPLGEVTAPDADPFDAFGYAIDVAGDLLVVGAPLDDDRGPSAGAVYLFRLRDGRAVLETKIPGTVPGDQYGTTVAVSADGRRFAVGARRGDGAAGADVGYVDVFDRVGGHWESDLRIQPGAARAGDEVGIDVSLSGSGVAVGAYKDDGGGTDAGAAYVLTPTADLALTKRLVSPAAGGPPPAPGEEVVFAVAVENRGPDDALGARVLDAPPEGVEDVTWICAAEPGARCTAAGEGALDDTVDLPAGATLTYTVTGTVSQGAAGELVNLASVDGPPGIFDPTSGNGADEAEVPVGPPRADLALAIRFVSDAAVPGLRVDHEVEIDNLGPSDAPTLGLLRGGLAAAFLDPVWTCTTEGSAVCVLTPNDPAEVGHFTLPAGTGVVFHLDSLVDPGARGGLLLAGDLGPLSGLDPNPGNNSASVRTPLEPLTDLAVTLAPAPVVPVPVTSGPGPTAEQLGATRQGAGQGAGQRPGQGGKAIELPPGGAATYTVRVTNDGPSHAFGARVVAAVPPGLDGAGWSCTASGGARCSPAGGGALADRVDLPVGSEVEYSFSVLAATGFLGPKPLEVSVAPAPAFSDPDPSNNRARDGGPLLLPTDLALTVEAQGSFVEGSVVTYEILVANGLTVDFPDLPGDEVTLPLPAALDPVDVTADVGEARIVSPTSVAWTGPLDAGEVVAIRLESRIKQQTRGMTVSTQALLDLEDAGYLLESSPPGALQSGPTTFVVREPLGIPTVSPWGLALLGLLLAGSALSFLRQRRTS